MSFITQMQLKNYLNLIINNMEEKMEITIKKCLQVKFLSLHLRIIKL